MKSETVRAGNYTISYTYRMSKKPLTILSIHGLRGSKGYWQPIYNYKELADYGILVPDLVGYGDSPTTRASITRCRSKLRLPRSLSTPLA